MGNIGLVLAVLGGLGLIFGITLPLLQEKLAVKEDPRIAELTALLPGFNCGSCGNPGCQGFAVSLLEGQTKELNKCRPGSKAKNYPIILEYLKNHGISDVK
jgi:electron transport complex protein RnfB